MVFTIAVRISKNLNVASFGWVFVPYLIAMMLFGGGQEEFGWRGYALPKLEENLGYWKANILLGTIWAVWHLPLWFIPGTSQQLMHFVGFMMLTIGYSFLFSWFRKWLAKTIFRHIRSWIGERVYSAISDLEHATGAPQPAFWIWVSLTLFSGIVVGLAFRRKAG
jgi:membrane protease YdiL (CAAX protease family)